MSLFTCSLTVVPVLVVVSLLVKSQMINASRYVDILAVVWNLSSNMLSPLKMVHNNDKTNLYIEDASLEEVKA